MTGDRWSDGGTGADVQADAGTRAGSGPAGRGRRGRVGPLLRVAVAVVGLAAVACAAPARATAAAPFTGDGTSRTAATPLAWALQAGASERSTAITAALTWAIAWPWGGEPSPWSLQLEASAGAWLARQPRAGDPERFWRVGLTPVLRYRFAATAPVDFAEAGIGVHLIGPIYRLGDRRFGSAFNFGDHLAVGWTVGPHGRDEWSLRLQHFSNAGLKPPNPGENFLQLRWSRRW